jgi:hypothetical protein
MLIRYTKYAYMYGSIISYERIRSFEPFISYWLQPSTTVCYKNPTIRNLVYGYLRLFLGVSTSCFTIKKIPFSSIVMPSEIVMVVIVTYTGDVRCKEEHILFVSHASNHISLFREIPNSGILTTSYSNSIPEWVFRPKGCYFTLQYFLV